MSVALRLESIRSRIDAAARRAGRNPGDVELVGIVKRQPRERVIAAVEAGLRCLGESYVQEARDRRDDLERGFAALGQGCRVSWRLVGRLQRNKAKIAAELFDAVDSVDRLELAQELDRRAAARGRPLEVCIQVNLSGEAQKGGLPETELPALLDACKALAHLRVVGLMTLPAAGEPEASRPAFARLRELRDTLRDRLDGDELSMGMSNDYPIAIEEGATLVRVGTALFGEREEQKR